MSDDTKDPLAEARGMLALPASRTCTLTMISEDETALLDAAPRLLTALCDELAVHREFASARVEYRTTVGLVADAQLAFEAASHGRDRDDRACAVADMQELRRTALERERLAWAAVERLSAKGEPR